MRMLILILLGSWGLMAQASLGPERLSLALRHTAQNDDATLLAATQVSWNDQSRPLWRLQMRCRSILVPKAPVIPGLSTMSGPDYNISNRNNIKT